MKRTTFFPSRVWLNSILISSIMTGIFYGIRDDDYIWGLIKIIAQFIIGFSIFLPFYFLWIGISHRILKNEKSTFLIKVKMNLLVFPIAAIFFSLNTTATGIEPNYFDGISFGIAMTFCIWYYKITYEAESSREDILDDNFHIPKI